MAKKEDITTGHSSKLLGYFLGDISKYQKILTRETKILLDKYPNKNLAPVFATLQIKLLTIGPMALCDYLISDLGKKCPDEILAAIGLTSLEISSHDDAVDETPPGRLQLSALIYAGNIATLEGVRILCQKVPEKIADAILRAVNKNHYLQQRRVECLWEKSPKNFREYQLGVKDGVALVEIGLFPAMVITRRMDLKERLTRFSKSYALVLQLIDDIREIDEDRVSGYHSFPMLEGEPFNESFRQINRHLVLAKKCLDPSWKRMNSLIENLKKLIPQIKNGISKT